MNKLINSLFLLFTFFFFACDSDTSHETKAPASSYKSPRVDSAPKRPIAPKPEIDEDSKIKISFTPAEQKLLFLIDSLPIGSNYKKAKLLLPSLSKPNKIDGIAVTSIKLQNENIRLELQFGKDTIQTINYVTDKKDNKQADFFFKALRNFYSQKIGQFEKERIEEENRFSPTYDFEYKNRPLSISNNINEGTVNWLFE